MQYVLGKPCDLHEMISVPIRFSVFPSKMTAFGFSKIGEEGMALGHPMGTRHSTSREIRSDIRNRSRRGPNRHGRNDTLPMLQGFFSCYRSAYTHRWRPGSNKRTDCACSSFVIVLQRHQCISILYRVKLQSMYSVSLWSSSSH